MVGPTAQLVALACHLNGRSRGLPPQPFFPANSTCQFCASVEFLRPRRSGTGEPDGWETAAETPDAWLDGESGPGRAATLLHEAANEPGPSDRMTAGFVGGGGRWLLAVTTGDRMECWQAAWKVGDRDAPDRRIWRVRYGLVGTIRALPPQRPLSEIVGDLHATLPAIRAFAEAHDLRGFAASFGRAEACLASAGPFAQVHHTDLAPPELLGEDAARLLACAQAAWVFGGMGSWNDQGFRGDEQERYERLSDDLFRLLNEAICVATNTTAPGAA